MEYIGKLYGKIGNKYFDTSHTSDDYDKLVLENKELKEQLRINNGSVYKDVICECGGNERIALDCTMKPCKHPKYSKN